MSETGIRADWASKDYYAVLGVDKKATQTDIKTTWPDGSTRFAILTASVPETNIYTIANMTDSER